VLAIKTAHDWVRAQAWAKKDAILLEGQSVGGLLTIVYGSTNPDGIRGFINFSGGAAGYPADRIGHSCSENQIREAATLAGKTNKTPSLWLYAENDGFWGSTAPEQWHTAFSQRSQVNSAFVLTPPIEGRDGHFLLNYGGKYWGTPVDNFLKSLSLGR
jgi:dienelactone hydrolase